MASIADMEEIGALLAGVPDEAAPSEAVPAWAPPPANESEPEGPAAPRHAPLQPSLFASPSPALASPTAEPATASKPATAETAPAPKKKIDREEIFDRMRSYLDAKGIERLKQVSALVPEEQRDSFLIFVSHYGLRPDDPEVASAGLAAFVASASRELPESIDRLRKAMIADHERFLAEVPEEMETRFAALAGQVEESIHLAHEVALESLEKRSEALIKGIGDATAASEKSLAEVSALAREAGESARSALDTASKEMIPTMAEAFEKSWERGLDRIRQAVAEEEKASRARVEEMGKRIESSLEAASRKSINQSIKIMERYAEGEVANSKLRSVWVPVAIASASLGLGALLASAFFLLT